MGSRFVNGNHFDKKTTDVPLILFFKGGCVGFSSRHRNDRFIFNVIVLSLLFSDLFVLKSKNAFTRETLNCQDMVDKKENLYRPLGQSPKLGLLSKKKVNN